MASVRYIGIFALLAQSAWLISSFHKDATKYCVPPSSVITWRAVAVGINAVSVLLAVNSAASDSDAADRYAIGACMLSTAATAVYAAQLDKKSVISFTGYGASLFSLVSALLLLSLAFDPQKRDDMYYTDYEVVIVER